VNGKTSTFYAALEGLTPHAATALFRTWLDTHADVEYVGRSGVDAWEFASDEDPTGRVQVSLDEYAEVDR
jgi:hypothetical protein